LFVTTNLKMILKQSYKGMAEYVWLEHRQGRRYKQVTLTCTY